MSFHAGPPAPGRPSPHRQRFRLTRFDVAPLRGSRDFRLLFFSQGFSVLGIQTRVVAVPFFVFQVTHSSLWVGAAGLAQLVPGLLIALFAGGLVENMDRRRLLLGVEGLLTGAALLLSLVHAGGPRSLALLLPLVVAAAGLDAVDQPSRTAVIPRLVNADQVTPALDLLQLAQQLGTIVGPLIVGALLDAVGPTHVFLFGAAASACSLLCLTPMRPLPPPATQSGHLRGPAAAWQALGYLRSHSLLQALYLIAANGTFIGGPYVLFPMLAVDVFHRGGAGLGLMYAAPGVGALTASIFCEGIAQLRHQGTALVACSALSGAAIAVFGLLTHSFWLALVLLSIVGASDMFGSVFREAILELNVPDHLRDRLSIDDFIFFSAGERLGDFKTSAIARWAGSTATIAGGGIAQVLFAAAISLGAPALSHYDRDRALDAAGG